MKPRGRPRNPPLSAAEREARRLAKNARQRERDVQARRCPEIRARQVAAVRAYRTTLTPEQRRDRAAKKLAWQGRNREHLRAYQAAYPRRKRPRTARAPRPAGFLANAAPSPERDLLARLDRLVPRTSYRDDVIAEAALYVLEGLPIADAVAGARRAVSGQARALWNARPLHLMWTI